MSPLELRQVFLGGVPAADNAEGGGERLDAVELARLPVVDGVGGDEVGQQARVRRLHPVERRVVQARPTGESITIHNTYNVCTYVQKLNSFLKILREERTFSSSNIMELGSGEIL